MQSQQFIEGTPVYDVNGDKVGTVSEHGVQQGYLVLHRGLLRDDVYVPLDRIQGNDSNGATVNMTKDEFDSLPVNAAPWERGTTSTAGMYAGDTATSGQMRGQTWTGAQRTQAGEVNVPVREEELDVAKQQQERGRVGIHKDVTEQQQTVSAPVTHEEVHVARTPVDRPADVPPGDWQEKDIDVPVRDEQLIAEKRPKVSEEVRVEKQPVTEEQQVSGTVRKEQVHVDGGDGDVPIQDATDQDQVTP